MKVKQDCFAYVDSKPYPKCLVLNSPNIKGYGEATTYCKIENCRFYKKKGEIYGTEWTTLSGLYRLHE